LSFYILNGVGEYPGHLGQHTVEGTGRSAGKGEATGLT